MKKLVTLLMILSLTAFTVGCGKKEEEKPPANTNGTTPENAEVPKEGGETTPPAGGETTPPAGGETTPPAGGETP
jgi:hypothetical protein